MSKNSVAKFIIIINLTFENLSFCQSVRPVIIVSFMFLAFHSPIDINLVIGVSQQNNMITMITTKYKL